MSALDEDTIEAMSKALADIKEWFEDQGAEAVIQNLAPGATLDHIVQVAGTHGLVVHPELQWLYMQHDGQPELERYPMFTWCTFFSVEQTLRVNHASMMTCYFGVKSIHDGIDAEYLTTLVFDEPLEPEELDRQWFPFANMDGDFFAVHARSGRVARFLKGDSPVGVILAPSLSDFLCDYADALWSDVYVIQGDTSLDFVEHDGLNHLGAYAGPPG